MTRHAICNVKSNEKSNFIISILKTRFSFKHCNFWKRTETIKQEVKLKYENLFTTLFIVSSSNL